MANCFLRSPNYWARKSNASRMDVTWVWTMWKCLCLVGTRCRVTNVSIVRSGIPFHTAPTCFLPSVAPLPCTSPAWVQRVHLPQRRFGFRRKIRGIHLQAQGLIRFSTLREGGVFRFPPKFCDSSHEMLAGRCPVYRELNSRCATLFPAPRKCFQKDSGAYKCFCSYAFASSRWWGDVRSTTLHALQDNCMVAVAFGA